MKNRHVREKIESYPEKAKEYAYKILSLLYETAKKEGIHHIEESLKWGEPSFKSVHGSPVRMDWKPNKPDSFFLFFNCKTILIETFREMYNQEIHFEGNRAIVLNLSEKIPEAILKHCISMAYNYYKLKKLPLLGA